MRGCCRGLGAGGVEVCTAKAPGDVSRPFFRQDEAGVPGMLVGVAVDGEEVWAEGRSAGAGAVRLCLRTFLAVVCRVGLCGHSYSRPAAGQGARRSVPRR